MDHARRRYHQAAITYFVYGVLYLAGALYLAGEGAAERGGAIWFGLGALMVVVLPLLVWNEFKWVTRILTLLVLVRIVGLVRLLAGPEGRDVPVPWGGRLPLVYGAVVFLAVAAVTAVMLARAAWPFLFERKRSAPPPV